MQRTLIWLGALLALGLLNFAIFQKERTLAEGKSVYLKLAPVDPRSLIQGDYMVLRYEIANQLSDEQLAPVTGRIVLQIDAEGIGRFTRLDDGTALAPDEHYLTYKNRRGARFGIESFFFQEGKGDKYADAEYSHIHLSPGGTAILVDLVEAPRL
jgi:uncharacterized membrane-anchored protein